MVKRCIGIDIDSSHLRAVQVSHTEDGFCIEKVFTAQTRRSTDSIPDVLRSLICRHKFDKRALLAISMPHNAVFFRNLETGSADAEQTRSLNIFALEHDFPIQPDEIVAQVCSCRRLQDGKYSVLAAAVPKKLLHERLNILAEAGMYPALVDAEIFAIHSTIAVNHPEIMTGRAIIVCVNQSYLTLAMTQDNNILIVRNTPVIPAAGSSDDSIREQIAELLSYEAQITWRKVFGQKIEQNAKLYLVCGDNACDCLETPVTKNLNCQIISVDPYAKVKNPSGRNGDVGISLAEGLALRALTPQLVADINFLNADNADIKPPLNLRKELAIFAALAAAIVVVSLFGLFTRLSHLETRYARLKNEISGIFQQVLPEEKNIVNPLIQLEQKLQSLQKYHVLLGPASETGLGPVEILYTISKSIPSEVNIDDMLITAGSVRLTGTSPSFESIYNWQQILEDTPQFSAADVRDMRRRPQSDLVHFTMLLFLETPEQK